MTINGVLSLMFVIAFCLKSEALASFPNGSAINSSSLAMDRTMHSGSAISQDKMPRLKNIPEFLMKIYLQENAKDGVTSKAGKTTPGTVHGCLGRVALLKNVVSFNVYSFNIEKKERLSSAKLRVMVEIASHVPSLQLHGDIVLYDQFSHEVIQSVAFRGSGTRWVMFSVRSMVQRWLLSQRLNYGVFVRAKSHNPNVNVSLTVKGGETGTKRSKLPLLVVKTRFVKHNRGEKLSSSLRSKQMFELTRRSRRHLAAIRDEGPCSIRPMTVDVRRHLGWNDVIIPREFESFRCGGECKFPLDTSVNPSGHAILRSILHSSGLDQGAGEPCCVPIKLRGVSMFEEDSQGHIELKTHQGTIVEECGCR